jgi:hypothetical protein
MIPTGEERDVLRDGRVGAVRYPDYVVRGAAGEDFRSSRGRRRRWPR